MDQHAAKRHPHALQLTQFTYAAFAVASLARQWQAVRGWFHRIALIRDRFRGGGRAVSLGAPCRRGCPPPLVSSQRMP
jgi:hypothetical protein